MNETATTRIRGAQQAAVPRWLLALMAVILLGLLAGGFWFYRSQEAHHRQIAEANLNAIAKLKVEQIVQWRRERLADAGFIMEGPFYVENMAALMAGSPAAAEKLMTRNRAISRHLGYQDVLLVSPAGEIRLSLSGEKGTVSPALQETVAVAFRARQPMLSDLHKSAADPAAHLDAVAPFFAGSDPDSPPLGAVVMRRDVSRFLY
ncbi:MAG TPA: hypothetical protein VLL73_06460, partial [Desulfurivibrionaceae bacterium]|nr:hypothetical protein [Desulfurivibrionaceae bacterium]